MFNISSNTPAVLTYLGASKRCPCLVLTAHMISVASYVELDPDTLMDLAGVKTTLSAYVRTHTLWEFASI